jgi:hypothetical protein
LAQKTPGAKISALMVKAVGEAQISVNDESKNSLRKS